MITVVLDTNVLVSATFWTGASFCILELIGQGKVKIVISKTILEEYNEIVNSDEIIQKPAYQHQRITSVHKVIQLATLVDPKEKIRFIKDDPDDDKFLEAAVEGKADYIVTQDKKHILPIKEFQGTKIVTPEEFLSLISQ